MADLLVEGFLAIVAIVLAIYYFAFRGLNFFKERDICHIKPWPIFGNMAPVMFRRQAMGHLFKKIYDINSEAKYVGFFDFMTPTLLIRDTELIKSIAVKNFDNFVNHRSFVNEVQEPLFGKNLFGLRDAKWRTSRSVLTPAFTSSKLKGMFKLMSNCASEFADTLSKMPSKTTTNMDIKDAITRFTSDVIATCAFGLGINSMEDPNNKFYQMGTKLTAFDGIRSLKFFLVRSLPNLTSKLGIRLLEKEVTYFFKNLVAETIRYREEKGIYRPDMLQLMMVGRDKVSEGKSMSIDDMTAHAFTFFFGGFDSSARLMCFIAQMIAVNPDVQEKLRNEVDNMLKETKGDLTYEALAGMEYLDAVVNETLRMYPVAIATDRVCTQSFELPPALPGGKPLTVEKGWCIWFPIYALHHDPKYFENPEVFDPDRFFGNNKKNLNNEAYLPFGLGPRMCIGNRFALLEAKILTLYLLARCELTPSAKTSIPLQLNRKGLNMMPENGFWLTIRPRSNPSPFLRVISDATSEGMTTF